MNARRVLLILCAMFATVRGDGCVYKKAEIVLLVDGSGSIRQHNFEIIINWLVNVTSAITDEFGDSVRLEVMQYSNRKRFERPFRLGDCTTVACMTNKIRAMKYLKGATYTYAALKKAEQDAFPASDWYPDSTKVIVLLTDGQATDSKLLSQWYDESKSANITTFAIGVSNYKLEELNLVANGGESQNRGDRVLSLGNFEELHSFVSTITKSIMEEVHSDRKELRSGPKQFRSKNYPDYVIGFDAEKLPAIAKESDETFRIVTPGISGQAGTVSFESFKFPGRYLRHRNELLYLDTFEERSVFMEDSTFFMQKDKYHQGFYAFESSNSPKHYIRHQGYRLKITKEETSDLFKNDASFQVFDNSITHRSAPKELQSKNYPNYVIGFGKDKFPAIVEGSDETFRIISPGISGKAGTISLESARFPGFYLRHRNYLLYLDSFDEKAIYFEDATFFLRQDNFFNGFFSFESSNLPGFFIRHQNYRLKLAENDGNLLFKNDASFKLSTVLANRNSGPKRLYSHNYPKYQIGYNNENKVSITDKSEETFQIQSPGLTGAPGTVSIASVDFPGHYLRYLNFLIYLNSYDEKEIYFKEATFRMRENYYFNGFVSFESVNFPGHFIRHQNYRLRISQDDGSELFKADASFQWKLKTTCSGTTYDENAECMETAEGYVCRCREGYTGDGTTCRAVKCSDNPCHVDADCTDFGRGFKCQCKKGYSGDGISCSKTNPLKYTAIGCWRDTRNRAIPKQDSKFDGPYKSRENAIEKCAALAHSQGYEIFGIQDGGWCASGPNAQDTYDQYGPSFACKPDGKGGPWANEVYQINAPERKYKYEKIGCFKDQGVRAIHRVEGRFAQLRDNYITRVDPIEKCAKAAAVLGYKMFAVQNGGWCATSDTAHNTFNVYGPSSACKDDGEGGPLANEVYEITYEDSVSSALGFKDLGCWRDTGKRAVPKQDHHLPGTNYKVRNFAIEKCAKLAHKQGHEIFAVQDGGWCASGSDARNTYWKYGPSSACRPNGKGGPWANQVYEINKKHEYTYEYVGCYRDTGNRAIPTVEGRFVKLRDQYWTRTDPLEKCADIAARLGHRIFALQNGGWCASSDTAENTYDKYGPSKACQSDGEGGPWANAVYRIRYKSEVALTDLGCWKDTGDRAIPIVDDQLPAPYKARINAVKQCAKLALSRRFSIFSIQHGGQCFTGPNARDTYQKYGMSTACNLDGKGGVWANQVYEINRPERKSSYSLIGCFGDKGDRAIPPVEKSFLTLHDSYWTRLDPLSKCAKVTSVLGNKVFALQHGGWCATSDTADKTYNVYGPSTSCKDDGEGGPWANAVYQVTYEPPVTAVELNDLGCWKDTGNRAIPNEDNKIGGPYKTRFNAIQKCAAYAKANGYDVFGVQDGGWCATGPDARKTFRKYRASYACKRDGKGGPSANQVYEIRKAPEHTWEYVGCFKDTGNRAIPTIEKRFVTLHDSYSIRKDPIEKCALAAASLGNDMFAVQHGGWCASSVTAQNTYNKYGTSGSCDADGEGGPWANAVYRVKYNGSDIEELKIGDLGCWKDTRNRAVPKQDQFLIGNYKTRQNAIKKCAKHAQTQGHEIFAIQDGGWCASGTNARDTYWKYGPSSACKADGRGGPWANQVYEINKKHDYTYEYVGCYRDTPNRAIPTVEGRFVNLRDNYWIRTDPLKKCADIAARLRHRIFALQNGGWCATTDTAEYTYDIYGPSTDCKDDGEGGPRANAVYKVKSDYKVTWTGLGCWGDKAERAVPPQDDLLPVPYKTRIDAIKQCADLADSKGYTVFAVQDGGWCATGPDARLTYKIYGPSTACKADGKGGPWANQVFEIDEVQEQAPLEYSDIGCFRDTGHRAIATVEGRFLSLKGSYLLRENPIEKCARVAQRLRYSYFAVQNGGWCATSFMAPWTYDRYGPSDNCREDGEGGPWANAVYKLRGVEQLKINDLGCWVDTANRAIPILDDQLSVNYHSRKDAISQCAQLAQNLGYDVFSVQDGGQCFGGACARATYQRYGPSGSCGHDGEGGPWANQVYEINAINSYSFEYVGCYRDTPSRAIPPVEGRYNALRDNYRARTDALAKCAHVAASMDYEYFAVQHSGWCATSSGAGSTYAKYGPSNACQSDKEGGPWANAVYRIIKT